MAKPAKKIEAQTTKTATKPLGRVRVVGYARVSTTDQDLTIQLEALDKAGCNVTFEEQKSGTKRDGRTELQKALEYLREGDVLVVTRLDRLGRSMRDLANIAHELQEVGASLRVIEQNVDTSTSAGRAFFNMLATFAEFETDVRRERQLEGIAAVKADPAKRAEKYKGRKASVDRATVARMTGEGMKPKAIATALGCSRMTIHRIINDATGENATAPAAS
jgi:DNA invertase Pin-like site-specific DNA recombinase